MGHILIYGAAGYTGRLLTTEAVRRGMAPVLAGRSRDKVEALARRFSLEARVFALDEPRALRAGLDGIATVLHAAGPFSATSAPMADACLATGAHYLDITGEIDVIEALAARDSAANAAGVVLMPGAGFDVVPTDCLAAHVAARLPGATRLRLTFDGAPAVSRGTAKSMVEAVAYGVRARQGGRIVELPGTPRARIDLGSGPKPAFALGWGDVASAWYSTRIPDISVYHQTTAAFAFTAGFPGLVRPLLRQPSAQRLLKRAIDRVLPEGPSPQARASGRHTFLAEVWDAAGDYAASRLVTPEGYTLTARTAVEIAARAAAGSVPAGFQTPSLALGADFILGFDGVTRTDVAG